MSANKVNTRIQMRRDTYANWALANPLLLEGELVFVIGDSEHPSHLRVGMDCKWSDSGIISIDSLATPM